MKLFKVLFVFSLLIFAGQLMAQDAYVSRNGVNAEVVLDAGDTISDNSTTLSKVFGLGAKSAVQLYSIMVSLDKVSGTPTQTWVLQGSLDGSNYSTISTVNYAGSADTVFYYTDISTGVAWSYLRVHGTEAGTGKVLLDKLIGRFLDEVK